MLHPQSWAQRIASASKRKARQGRVTLGVIHSHFATAWRRRIHQARPAIHMPGQGRRRHHHAEARSRHPYGGHGHFIVIWSSPCCSWRTSTCGCLPTNLRWLRMRANKRLPAAPGLWSRPRRQRAMLLLANERYLYRREKGETIPTKISYPLDNPHPIDITLMGNWGWIINGYGYGWPISFPTGIVSSSANLSKEVLKVHLFWDRESKNKKEKIMFILRYTCHCFPLLPSRNLKLQLWAQGYIRLPWCLIAWSSI